LKRKGKKKRRKNGGCPNSNLQLRGKRGLKKSGVKRRGGGEKNLFIFGPAL